jgi:hypothetical protein
VPRTAGGAHIATFRPPKGKKGKKRAQKAKKIEGIIHFSPGIFGAAPVPLFMLE